MARVELSLIIPARNEEFLGHTVRDALRNIRGNTEIIVGLDGDWPVEPIEENERVHIIHHSVSIGQRAICNEMVRYSRARYVMKADGHCAFDEGFDVKLLADMQPDLTMVPVMRNLHVFDWVCQKCGERRYQGPSGPCTKCGSPTAKDVVWIPKTNPQSTAYCFDPEPHFQYFKGYKDRVEHQEGRKKGMTETMSLQGSCFLVERSRFISLDLCDETFGSWGSQGIEVAVKSWLSGGRVVCNHKTWYGHCFRTQGGDFGFPYSISGRQVEHAKHYARDLFFSNKWPHQVRPLSWLIEKFWPVPGWNEDARMAVREQGKGFEPVVYSQGAYHSVTKAMEAVSMPKVGLCYYTDNRLDRTISTAVQRQIKSCLNGHRLVSVSLQPMGFGENITLPLQRGHLAMAKQQLAGLQRLKSQGVEIAFMVEHDVLYPPCHFAFVPPRNDTFYYNLNWWKVRAEDGQALHFKAKQVSGLCAYIDILIEYFSNRVRLIESGEIGGRRHFEPGTRHYREPGYNKLTDKGFDTWWSEIPYVDIRHKTVITRNIFDPSGYRGQVVDWTMADEIPHWGTTKGRFAQWLKEAVRG